MKKVLFGVMALGVVAITAAIATKKVHVDVSIPDDVKDKASNMVTKTVDISTNAMKKALLFVKDHTELVEGFITVVEVLRAVKTLKTIFEKDTTAETIKDIQSKLDKVLSMQTVDYTTCFGGNV